MPARNKIEDIILEFNSKGQEFSLEGATVVHYQNLKDSAIIIINLNKEQIIKSAQGWRVFFSQLNDLKKTSFELALKKAQKSLVQQKREKAYEKLLLIAKKRNHAVFDFTYEENLKHSTFTILCLDHNIKYKKISYLKYMHPKIKFGLPCCIKDKKKRKT